MTFIYLYNESRESCSHIGSLLFRLSHVHSFAQVSLASVFYSRENHTNQVVQKKKSLCHKIST